MVYGKNLKIHGSQSTVNPGLLWILKEFCHPLPSLAWLQPAADCLDRAASTH